MSFLKQPFDFLIDRDDMIDVTFPGYIMILVVCAVTLFLIIPKGDTVITPVMETTVTETVEMTDPRMVTKGEEGRGSRRHLPRHHAQDLCRLRHLLLG